MNTSTRILLLVFSVLLTVGGLVPASFADDHTDLHASEASKFPKPRFFTDLHEFISKNFENRIEQGSVNDATVEGRPSVTFSALDDDGVVRQYTLTDYGDTLVLGTNVSPAESTAGTPTTLAATAANPCDVYRCNCVLYARCRVPTYPRPATWWQEKLNTINSYTPRVGDVVIMEVGLPYGHVGVVTWVLPDGRIGLDEANYRSCQVGSRIGYPSALKVRGYYHPQ